MNPADDPDSHFYIEYKKSVNPGSEYLIVQSGPQVSGAVFRMCDMQGRQVMEERLTSAQMRFNTGGLASGAYPWQIIFNNKVIESGKWVKGE